jgi:hypothetical protein
MTSEKLVPLLPVLEKLGFAAEFVEKNVLARSGTVTVSEIAMLWQGMPNKHDRKRTRALFDALAEAGLLTLVDDASGTFTVVGFGGGRAPPAVFWGCDARPTTSRPADDNHRHYTMGLCSTATHSTSAKMDSGASPSAPAAPQSRISGRKGNRTGHRSPASVESMNTIAFAQAAW